MCSLKIAWGESHPEVKAAGANNHHFVSAE